LQEQERAAEILRRTAQFLRTLTEDEIDDLITGKARLMLTTPTSRRPPRGNAAGVPDIDGLRQELGSKASRDDGLAYLDELSLNRESLRQVAVALDLPTPRTDTVARLKDRIVEATIGYKLRSKAIRHPN